MLDHATGELAEPKETGAEDGIAPLVATTPAAVSSAPEREAEDRAWSAEHAINVRCTLPTPFGRYYLTILSGKERRSGERLTEERFKHPLNAGGNNVFLFLAGAVFSLACLAVLQSITAYLMDGGGGITLP